MKKSDLKTGRQIWEIKLNGRKGSDHELGWAMKRWSLSCQKHGWHSCRVRNNKPLGSHLTSCLRHYSCCTLFPPVLQARTFFRLCKQAKGSPFLPGEKTLNIWLGWNKKHPETQVWQKLIVPWIYLSSLVKAGPEPFPAHTLSSVVMQ